ncbi:VWA domain-containing protein [Neorhodopirellula pilleata]|uniref:VWFA domain-containing protein n=1 Tax=Neorhodopirellula pilleata TaxID=2714738 RepID=A0A5C5ZY62_9BACT|nr:vWA domain-containing protein [Neorhodopirellula pilleata]TWT91857.1 hypothetical protein Pla100_48950 [Neorhodopirellula pilleata]
MKRLHSLFATLALLCLFGNPVAPHGSAQDVTIEVKTDNDSTVKVKKKGKSKPPFAGQRPEVNVAILLDTSNSMDGLINQAKSQLWNIVQEFAKAKKNGKTPLLRVSVFEYGNTRLPASEDYIRQVAQLTDDLDKVSEALFALTTSGGDEYCGAVIAESVKRLDWSSEPNAYKAIFIAGNEPFDQGSVDFQGACKNAIQSGIVVNTIHCGNYQQGVDGKWQKGAQLAEGKFMNINQDEKVTHIPAPQDKIIIELNTSLNQTYLWFGSQDKREGYALNQMQQDSNAGSSLSSRALIKSSPLYRNVGRDLVDTFEENPAAIVKLGDAELPKELQGLTSKQRLARIEEMSKRRAEIKSQLADANRQREAFIADQQAKQAASSSEVTLGDAFKAAVQEQLQTSGFEVE